MVELEETKRDLAQKEESMRHMMERLQRLEDSKERQNHRRRWEPRRARYQMHYGSQEEEDEIGECNPMEKDALINITRVKCIMLNCLLLIKGG